MRTLTLLALALSLIVLLLLPNSIGAQHDLIKSRHLRKDFESYVGLLEAHPNPYRHITEQVFAERIKAVRNRIKKPMTLIEFYKQLSSISALIRDGHSYVGMPRFWEQNKFKEDGVFPLKVHLSNDDELYVLKSYQTDDPIPSGVRIMKINGISIDSFIRGVDPFISYERKAFRNYRIESKFYLYLLLHFGNYDGLKFEYFTSEKKVTKVHSIPHDHYFDIPEVKEMERESRDKANDPYTYELISDGIGLLTVHSFAPSSFEEYENFLSRTFRKVNRDNIHSLIIDVRGNLGGYPKASSALCHYFSNGSFKCMAQTVVKVSEAYKKFFYDRSIYARHNLINVRHTRHFLDLNTILNGPIGSMSFESDFYNESPQEKQHEYDGDIYVVIDRRSFSAASSFAATVKCYQMGLLIGEETGGTSVFHANSIYEELYHTQLITSVATTTAYTTCFNNPDEGIKPDLKFSPSILDLSNDHDSMVRFTELVVKKISTSN